MQKNIDSETLRFSELVISYTMFLNEFTLGLTIILFLFFFNGVQRGKSHLKIIMIP